MAGEQHYLTEQGYFTDFMVPSSSTSSSIDNIIIGFSRSIVKLVYRRLGLKTISLPSCPIWFNPVLSVGGRPLKNDIWQRYGIETVGQIFKDKMLQFEQLQNQFGRPDSSFLTYAQLSSIINKKCKEGTIPASCL